MTERGNVCGGIAAKLGRIPKDELEKYYDERRISMFQDRGEFVSNFWDAKPVLPIEVDGKIVLKYWGNRDKNAPFPQTGWAKMESIKQGKWEWLSPKPIKILVDRGVEKGVWFEFCEHQTNGILVEKDGDERAYMITEAASEGYQAKTGHNRMPIGEKTNFQERIK